MMPTPSKRVAGCAQVARTVTSAAELRGSEIAAALEPLLFPDTSAPRAMTLDQLIVALASMLSHVQANLETTDIALAKELGDDIAARDARDQRYTDLRTRVMAMRTMIDGMFGSVELSRSGLSGVIPTAHDELIQMAVSAASQIETSALEAPDGVSLDRPTLADGLRLSAEALRATLVQHQREERETQSSRAVRDAQLDEWTRVYPGVADVLAGLATMCGRSDIAERVRPTARRRQGLPEPVDLEPTPIPIAGPADGPGDGPTL